MRLGLLRTGVLVAAGTGILGWAAVPAPIAGIVVDHAGHPLIEASVTVTSWPLWRSTVVRTDSSGAYHVLGHLWPSDRTVTVAAPGFRAQRTSGGRLVLQRWPWISGKVTDDVGDTVAGAVVTVSRGRASWRGASDENGLFGFTAAAPGGSATITTAAPNHDRATRRVSLDMDHEVALAPVLVRHVGFLKLDSDPQGVQPEVDGKTVKGCPGTPCQVAVLVGRHVVGVGGDLYLPWSQQLVLTQGQAMAVQLQLTRKTGTLNIGAPGGELLVDGKQVANGAWGGAVPTGHHSVAFRSATTWPLFAAADVAWNQTAGLTLQPHAVVPGDAGAFTDELRAYLNGLGGSYGVWIQEPASGRTLALGQDTRLEAASVIKVPEALYLLHQVDAGAVKLTDQVTLQAQDFMSGTGILYGRAHPGDQFAYQDLLSDLIRYSDNTAWRALLRVLGIASIDSYAASLGAGDCHQWDDGCTAREAGSLMVQLALGRLLSAGSTQLLLRLLESTVFNDRINYYLPGLTIAHKVGMDGGVRNDCGIVYAPGSPFVICVFTTTNDPDMGVQAIRDITRAAYRYLGH